MSRLGNQVKQLMFNVIEQGEQAASTGVQRRKTASSLVCTGKPGIRKVPSICQGRGKPAAIEGGLAENFRCTGECESCPSATLR